MIQLFTDSDLDGLASGILAKIAFKDKVNVFYCTYRNLDRRVGGFLNNPKNKETKVYITDLSINKENADKLDASVKKGRFAQMIDHHATAMHFNEYSWGFVKTEYSPNKKTCAASLFYDYLIEHEMIKPTPAINQFIELTRLLDTWEWEPAGNTDAKRLNDFFFMIGRESFEEKMLERLQQSPESFTLNADENWILDIEEEKIDRYVKRKSHQTIQADIDGLCMGIVHGENYTSELGNRLNKQWPHLDLIAIINVGNKSVGLRTIHDHVNVSELAKKYDGGGHPKASGCALIQENFNSFVVDLFNAENLKPDPEDNEHNVKESKYGSYFKGHDDTVYTIKPIMKGSWGVYRKDEKLKTSFTFEEAERWLKRTYICWLMKDAEAIDYIATTFEVEKEKLSKKYSKVMDQLLTLQNQ